jgi:hypothetical protein
MKKHCEFHTDEGIYCGLKSVQIVVDFSRKRVFQACRKHKLSRDKGGYENIK